MPPKRLNVGDIRLSVKEIYHAAKFEYRNFPYSNLDDTDFNYKYKAPSPVVGTLFLS